MSYNHDPSKSLIFIPDISIFQDAFKSKPQIPNEITARIFFNHLALINSLNGTVLLRVPIEVIVTLMQEKWMNRIWGQFKMILKQEPEAKEKPDTTCEQAVIDLYSFLQKYKNPIVLSNIDKVEYKAKNIPVMNTVALNAIINQIPELCPKSCSTDKN